MNHRRVEERPYRLPADDPSPLNVTIDTMVTTTEMSSDARP